MKVFYIFKNLDIALTRSREYTQLVILIIQIRDWRVSNERSIVSITLDKFHFSRNSTAPFHVATASRFLLASFRSTKGTNITDGLFSRPNSMDSILDFQSWHSRRFRHRSRFAKLSWIGDRYTTAVDSNNGLESVDLKRAGEWKTHTIYNGQW